MLERTINKRSAVGLVMAWPAMGQEVGIRLFRFRRIAGWTRAGPERPTAHDDRRAPAGAAPH